MSRWARPARPRAPIGVAAMIVVLWWLVAHNGGSGWVQVLGDLVFGALLVGILGPFLVVQRAKIEVGSAPADAVAGTPVEVRVRTRTRLRVRPVQPGGDETFVGPAGGSESADDPVTLRPTRHGVHDSLTLDIASAAPFGLQWWTRRVRVDFPAALYVSPRRGRPERPQHTPHEEAGETRDRPRTDAGFPRGARPYGPGDSRRLVHWRATAHTGGLMVRELERPVAGPIAVTVELPDDEEEGERVVERALGTVVNLLDTGTPVVLRTRERSGPVVAPVADRRGAGRRLARAVAPGTGGPHGGHPPA